MPKPPDITLEDLKERFNRPLADVAAEYGVCLTYIKKLCRSYDIKRWPYRKIKSLQTKADKLAEIKANSAASAVRKFIKVLQDETGNANQLNELVPGAITSLPISGGNGVFYPNSDGTNEWPADMVPQLLAEAYSQQQAAAAAADQTENLANSAELVNSSATLPFSLPRSTGLCDSHPVVTNWHTTTLKRPRPYEPEEDLDFEARRPCQKNQVVFDNVPPRHQLSMIPGANVLINRFTGNPSDMPMTSSALHAQSMLPTQPALSTKLQGQQLHAGGAVGQLPGGSVGQLPSQQGGEMDMILAQYFQTLADNSKSRTKCPGDQLPPNSGAMRDPTMRAWPEPTSILDTRCQNSANAASLP